MLGQFGRPRHHPGQLGLLVGQLRRNRLARRRGGRGLLGLRFQRLQLLLQPRSLPLDRYLQRMAFALQGVVLFPLLLPAGQSGLGRLVGEVSSLDGRGAGHQIVIGLELAAALGGLALNALEFGPRLGQLGRRPRQQRLLLLDERPLRAQLGHQGVLGGQLGGDGRLAGHSQLQLALPLCLQGQFGFDVGQLPVEYLGLCFGGLAPVGGSGLVLVPTVDAQDAGQNLLALVGRLGGELVGLALQQEAGVGEDVVGHAQQAFDGPLGVADARIGQRAPAHLALGLVAHVQLQLHRLAHRLAADDAIDGPLQVEDERHLGRLAIAGGDAVDDVIVAARPALTEQRPGDAVEDA